jgi:hypothetical protein
VFFNSLIEALPLQATCDIFFIGFEAAFGRKTIFSKIRKKPGNLELKKSGKICCYLCEFLSSKFNLLCFCN